MPNGGNLQTYARRLERARVLGIELADYETTADTTKAELQELHAKLSDAIKAKEGSAGAL